MLQVTEVQTRSSLPHDHSVLWRDDLSEPQQRVLTSMQADHCFMLSPEEVESIVQLGTKASSACLDAVTLRKQFPKLSPGEAQQVVALAKVLQVHRCVPYCQDRVPALEFCKQYFPLMPSLYPHMALRPKLETDQDRHFLLLIQDVWYGLKGLLIKDKQQGRDYSEGGSAASILSLARRWAPDGDPIPMEGGGFFWGGVELADTPWLQWHLAKCGEFTQNEDDRILLGIYHYVTSIRLHAKLILQRKCEEAFVAPFNPLILLTTMANHQIDLVTHTVGQMESYMVKGNGARDGLARTARELEKRGVRGQISAYKLEAKVEAGMCERTLTEALFTGLDSRLKLVNKVNLLDPVLLPLKTIGHGQATINEVKLRYSRRGDNCKNLTLAQWAMWIGQPGDHSSTEKPTVEVKCKAGCMFLLIPSLGVHSASFSPWFEG